MGTGRRLILMACATILPIAVICWLFHSAPMRGWQIAGGVLAYDVTPAGDRVAYIVRSGLRCVDLRDMSSRVILPIRSANRTDPPPALRWSPDGRRIALVLGGMTRSISLLDVGSGAVRVLAARGQVSAVAWSPDGRRLAYGERIGSRTTEMANGLVVRAVDGRPLTQEIPLKCSAKRVEWTGDGHRVLVQHDDSSLEMIRVDSIASQASGAFIRGYGKVEDWDLSPDRKLLAYSSMLGLYTVSIDSDCVGEQTTDDLVKVRWDSDGRSLLILREAKAALDRVPQGGWFPRRLTYAWPTIDSFHSASDRRVVCLDRERLYLLFP